MRKKIQNHPSRHAEFFTKQEGIGVLTETFALNNNDQFIDASALKQIPDFAAVEHANEFQPPHIVTLDGSSKLMGGTVVAYHRDMADVQSPMFGDFHQNDSIGNKKDVIDDQRQQ